MGKAKWPTRLSMSSCRKPSLFHVLCLPKVRFNIHLPFLFMHDLYAVYLHVHIMCGSWDSLLVQHQTHDGKDVSLNPFRSGRRIFSPELTFYADLFGVHSALCFCNGT